MWQPRTFIVRLYPDGPGRTVGLLEDAGSGRQFHFSNKEELWSLLHSPTLSESPEAQPGWVQGSTTPGSRRD